MGAETLIHARTPLGSDMRVVVPREIKVKSGEALQPRARTRARRMCSTVREGRCAHER